MNEASAILREAMSFDYEPYDSPQQMLEGTQSASLAEISSVTRGLVDMGPEKSGVLLINLEEIERWKGVKEKAYSIMIYWPEEEPIDELQKGLPEGTRVAAFADKAARTPEKPVEGSAVLETVPQGLLIEAEDGSLVSVWGDSETTKGWEGIDTVDALRSALKLPDDSGV